MMASSTLLSAPPMTPCTPQTTDATHLQPRLQNIVSTVNLGCKLDLKRIALQARNAEYNPKRFAAVIMRIRNPRTTALIFSSGKMVCTGAKSEEDSLQASRRYARVVQKLGFLVKFRDFKIQNMVGSVGAAFPIRLEALVLKHYQFCSYEPELFPGLIYRMISPKIVLLIFVSGKVVLTGAKSRQDIHEAFDRIYPILKGFLFGGPLAGAACCTACCAPQLIVPGLGWAGFGICEPVCLASIGTAPPCTVCAAAFLAPTP
ncbi:unnamed protein product [Rotaria socialis]|uniref:TATA-box-binding protein n=1 Tax=Rotaria socialis TaxID=392032 RepID=A0A818IJ29_9BILA|nr:unnamed protein product [Rotaria socialis]